MLHSGIDAGGDQAFSDQNGTGIAVSRSIYYARCPARFQWKRQERHYKMHFGDKTHPVSRDDMRLSYAVTESYANKYNIPMVPNAAIANVCKSPASSEVVEEVAS